MSVCARVCTICVHNMCAYKNVCADRFSDNEFSEYFLETRVQMSVAFNTYLVSSYMIFFLSNLLHPRTNMFRFCSLVVCLNEIFFSFKPNAIKIKVIGKQPLDFGKS